MNKMPHSFPRGLLYFFCFIFVWTPVYGANYAPWQSCYDLWMPQIETENLAGAVKPQELPFPVPQISFDAPMTVVKAPISPESSLPFKQSWFSRPEEEQHHRLLLQIAGGRAVELSGLSISQLPSRVWGIKTASGVFVLAAWPSGMSLEERRMVMAAVKTNLQPLPQGEYDLLIYRE